MDVMTLASDQQTISVYLWSHGKYTTERDPVVYSPPM